MKKVFFISIVSFFVLTLVGFFKTASAVTISTYHIGNSLTWDAIKKNTLKDLFENAGITLNNNYHIKCSGALTYILSSPDVTCVTPNAGQWNEALSNNTYDFLILQPSAGSHTLGEVSTTEAEIAAMQSFSSKTNARLAIYQSFPYLHQAADISSFYKLPDASLFRSTKAEFSQIKNALPDAVIIPTMEVLIELDFQARQGNIPDVSTAQDFYRDGAHLNEFGRYALALTHFSALTGLDPSLTGLELPDDYVSITDEQILMVQKVVRDVVLTQVPLPSSLIFFCTSFLIIFGTIRANIIFSKL